MNLFLRIKSFIFGILVISLSIGCTITLEITPRRISLNQETVEETINPDNKVQTKKKTTKSKSASFKVKDSKKGELSYNELDGHTTLKAINDKGEVVFDGPINTEEERSKVPDDFLSWLDEIKKTYITK